MINIVLDCSIELKENLINIMNDYDISMTTEINNQSIIIKEIHTINDIKDLEKRKNQFHCHVICIINDPNLAFDAIDLLPLSIWRKQNLIHDCQTLTDIISHKNIINDVMKIKSNSNTIIVNTKDIIYLESFSHYLVIHTINSDFRIREKISIAKERLKNFGFIQIHKSYLVNKKYIQTINSTSCKLRGDIILPIGKKYNQIQL